MGKATRLRGKIPHQPPQSAGGSIGLAVRRHRHGSQVSPPPRRPPLPHRRRDHSPIRARSSPSCSTNVRAPTTCESPLPEMSPPRLLVADSPAWISHHETPSPNRGRSPMGQMAAVRGQVLDLVAQCDDDRTGATVCSSVGGSPNLPCGVQRWSATEHSLHDKVIPSMRLLTQ